MTGSTADEVASAPAQMAETEKREALEASRAAPDAEPMGDPPSEAERCPRCAGTGIAGTATRPPARGVGGAKAAKSVDAPDFGRIFAVASSG